MKVYAHRANLWGPNTGDNRLDAIRECLRRGLGVEVDVWGVGEDLWLGHDRPVEKVALPLLAEPLIMCHAKNIEAALLLQRGAANFFSLEKDEFALCSNGLIWTNYGCQPTTRSIVCSPELVRAPETLEDFWKRIQMAHGVCTDFPLQYLDFCQRITYRLG